MKIISVVTTNDAKFEEFSNFFKKNLPDIKLQRISFDFDELQHDNPNEVIKNKLDEIKKITKQAVLVDDAFFVTKRFPLYPGCYAKFINKSLGLDGWKKLFKNGDKIKAIAHLGFSYLGQDKYFKGTLEGELRFDHRLEIDSSMPLNGLFYLPKHKNFLGKLVAKKNFLNHRHQALTKFVSFIKNQNKKEVSLSRKTARRWNGRAVNWQKQIAEPSSYVNYENGYERFNKALKKIIPVAAPGRAVDMGCGTGDVARILASEKKFSVFGYDVAAKMLKKAKELSKSINIKYFKGDFYDLKPNTCSIIVSRGVVVSHIPNTQLSDFFYFAANSLREGGFLVFDFIHNLDESKFPSKWPKNILKIDFLDKILKELGLCKIYEDAPDKTRVGIVVYFKPSSGSKFFVTGNPQKVLELNEALPDSLRLTPSYLELDEIKSDSLEKITIHKLKQAFTILNRPVICTDGGIFIDALNGFPGSNSKMAAIDLGPQKITDLLRGESNRQAFRRNTIGFFDGKKFALHTAEVPCLIADSPRKPKYKSYPLDTILIPKHKDNPELLTYGEIPVEERARFTELPESIEFLNKVTKNN